MQCVSTKIMIKMIAFFNKPTDVEAFDKHYNEVHAPLMRKVPGLEKLEATRVTKTLMGSCPHYLIAEMTFASDETFKAAMASPENKAAGADLMSFAKELVTLVITK